MFRRVADNRNPHSLAARLRRRRLGLFYALIGHLEGPIRILDVGGTQGFWQVAGLPKDRQIHITLLNLSKSPTTLAGFASVAGDARDLQFPDEAFDVVFSNSVIEHVGDFDDQRRMAREVVRVGKRYFIQTPNRHFPIEPHFLFPFFQFLPNPFRVWLLQHFRLGWIRRTPDRTEAARVIAGIRLLDRAEFSSLFPGSEIYEERFLGLTKSFVACGGWNLRPGPVSR